jgi:hypothetical protein
MIRDAEWDQHIASSPEGTFYHTRIWSRILAATFPSLKDASRWLEIEGSPVALSLYVWNRLGGLLSTRHSSFPFLYGGPISSRIGGRDILMRVLQDLARGRQSLVLIPSPFAPHGAAVLDSAAPEDHPAAQPDSIAQADHSKAASEPIALPGAVRLTEDATHILQLPSTFEDFWEKTLTTSKRNDVRRLTKKGVTLRCGGSAGEIAAVYDFYNQSFVRWGGPPRFVYPEALYRHMVELGEGHVRLYLAHFNEKIIGGAFVVRWNGHVHYHAGYFDHEARSLRPNVLLQERIIRDAIKDRFRDYDFLPSGGNKGVETFKESFGGKRTIFCRYEYRAPFHRLIDRFGKARA